MTLQNCCPGSCWCAALEHAGNEIGNEERWIKCDTIQVYMLCLLARGIYGRKERAHRNPLMEPDYLFALKLIECRAEREGGGGGVACACVIEREKEGEREREISGSLYPFLPFFKQILLCLHRERQMGWGVGVKARGRVWRGVGGLVVWGPCMNMRGCDPAGVCCWSSDRV